MKIVSIVGARPQFIKCGPVSRRIRRDHEEILVHTGQHYDKNMSEVFFSELEIPLPEFNLEVGSGSHADQTSRMLVGIEQILLDEQPDAVLIYGDTNSTLAGALAGAKLHIPVAHVEAGLRSFDRAMPEEINRIVADHVSDLLFCPTPVAADNLMKEGITRGVFVTGDVMTDSLLHVRDSGNLSDQVVTDAGLEPDSYLLATIHRASNTDSVENLTTILDAFSTSPYPVLFPIHPRTRNIVRKHGLEGHISATVRIVDPLPYITMLSFMSHAKGVLTDSGGIQKEAYILKKPCITIRDTTEWIETVEDGWNILTGADGSRITDAILTLDERIPSSHSSVYGDGTASEQIVAILKQHLSG